MALDAHARRAKRPHDGHRPGLLQPSCAIPDPKLGPRKVDIATMYNTDRYRPNYASKTGLPIFLTRA